MSQPLSAAKTHRCWAWRLAFVVLLGFLTTAGIVIASAYLADEPIDSNHAHTDRDAGSNLVVRHRSQLVSNYEVRGYRDDLLMPEAPSVSELIGELQNRHWTTVPPSVPTVVIRTSTPILFDRSLAITVDAFGWPFRCAGAYSVTDATSHEILETYGGVVIGTRKTTFAGSPSHLPLTPLWDGLLANVAIYGMIWFVLLFGWRDIRRVLRVKRGRCPQCGYDLRGEFKSGCAECGWNRADHPVV